MTQEEKRLLLIDLCARLPHGVKVRNVKNNFDINNFNHNVEEIKVLIEEYDIKPYLRPMSSMTMEERNEITAFGIDEINESIVDFGEFICEGSPVQMSTVTNIIDYLNEHHFDYRGLIEKGLAIVAPEEMYKQLLWLQ